MEGKSQNITGDAILKRTAPTTKTPDRDTIDGDKVIAFIKAVENLGEILNHLNVIEIKDAFIVGKEIQSVERVIDTEKKWRDALACIREGFKEDMDSIVANQKYARAAVETLKLIASYAHSRSFDDVLSQLQKLNAVCDQLEKHRNSGLLEALNQFAKPTT